MIRMTATIIAASAIAACAPVEDDAEFVSKAPAAKVLGESKSCIQLSSIRNSVVHDDRTIDFKMSGGKVFRNTLPRKCSGLGFEEAFSYETSLGQLCNTDIIYVLDQTGGSVSRGAGCGLGKFTPIEYTKD